MQNENDKIGWKKGIYPTDKFIFTSLKNGELYTLTDNADLCGCVVLNSICNEGYDGLPWSIDCKTDEVLIPHALAVSPKLQGRGVGKQIVNEIIKLARIKGKKSIRLDILGTNIRAEQLYTNTGFQLVSAKKLFYEDTGLTEYKIFEMNL